MKLHPNPCLHTDDPCIDGTHYCESMPCVMDDARWPCLYAMTCPTRGEPAAHRLGDTVVCDRGHRWLPS